MPVTDPIDARLLAALAEVGTAAVHELAARLGMDPREVAYRLVALSGSGLPLLVGVQSDPRGLRAALAASGPPGFPGAAGPLPAAAARPPAGGHPPPAPAARPGQPTAPPQAHPAPAAPPPPPAREAPPAQAPDSAISTWGPPQTAAWARGDRAPTEAVAGPGEGARGSRADGRGQPGPIQPGS